MNKAKVYWHDEAKTIVRQEYFQGFTTADAREGITFSRTLIDSVPHKVSFITEFHNLSRLPLGYLNEVRYVSGGLRDNHEISIIVGSGFAGRMVIDLIRRLRFKIATTLYLVDSVDEALALIANYRKKNVS